MSGSNNKKLDILPRWLILGSTDEASSVEISAGDARVKISFHGESSTDENQAAAIKKALGLALDLPMLELVKFFSAMRKSHDMAVQQSPKRKDKPKPKPKPEPKPPPDPPVEIVRKEAPVPQESSLSPRMEAAKEVLARALGRKDKSDPPPEVGPSEAQIIRWGSRSLASFLAANSGDGEMDMGAAILGKLRKRGLKTMGDLQAQLLLDREGSPNEAPWSLSGLTPEEAQLASDSYNRDIELIDKL